MYRKAFVYILTGILITLLVYGCSLLLLPVPIHIFVMKCAKWLIAFGVYYHIGKYIWRIIDRHDDRSMPRKLPLHLRPSRLFKKDKAINDLEDDLKSKSRKVKQHDH